MKAIYDFQTCPDRKDSGSVKWAEMKMRNPHVQKGIVPFSVADMEFRVAPEIITGLQRYLESASLGYTQATDEYYHAVMGWMERRHQWNIKQEWIVPMPGVVSAIVTAIQALTQPGEGVLVMTPVYYPFYWTVRDQGRKLVEIPLRNNKGTYEIDFSGLENAAKDPNNKLLLFCSPHNPVGRVWTKEELKKVDELCTRYGIIPVIDEIHHDLIMPGYTHTVFPKVCDETEGKYVVCTAPSKTFNLAGMQTSNIIIPKEEVRSRFVQAKRCAALIELNAMGYRACEIAYTQCEKWLDELIDVINGNQKMLESFFAEYLPQVRVTKLEGTYLQWLDFRALEIPYQKMEQLMAEKAQVFFDEGYIFGTGGQGFERMNLACPRPVLQAALERLRTALRQYC